MSGAPTALILVFSSPRSMADEPAFDRWYDEVHVPQVVAAVAGVVSGRRFVRSTTQLGDEDVPGPRRRLTIYDVEPGRVDDAVAGLRAALQDGSLDRSELVDRGTAPPEIVVYEGI